MFHPCVASAASTCRKMNGKYAARIALVSAVKPTCMIRMIIYTLYLGIQPRRKGSVMIMDDISRQVANLPDHAPRGNPIITMKNVVVAYGDQVALWNINLDILEGEYLGIIGPNGSGKTTLFKVILGLKAMNNGSIQILGQSLHGDAGNLLKGASWKDKIAYVPQRFTIDRNFPARVWDIVRMGRAPSHKVFSRFTREDKEQVMRCLEVVGMENFSNRPIGHLSGGQQQKVLIAKALAKEPDILLLDEPTSALDFKIAQDLIDLLGRLHEKEKLTIIEINHNLRLLRDNCERLVILNKTIEWIGDPNDPKADEKINEIFFHQ
ncbi:ATP-binding cassette domain-containing protein [Candidatus Bathyarchaeota archaeon]|nr:ATP-binding cassette domain-containing protein [Candidatus Bathyarchaeota archaeon]